MDWVQHGTMHRLSHSEDENIKSLCTIMCTISFFKHFICFNHEAIYTRMTH